MRGKRGMESKGKIQWMDKWVRERERERDGVGTQRNLADCSTSESLNRFVTERNGERVGEMRGGI